jgi:1-acyl-sn-glycerol-3-phosphate acyltransferase
MAFPPTLARTLANALLPPEQIEALRSLRFNDAGHGYDPFGMHPSFVAFGVGLTRFLYERYFRVISTGHEHIPVDGPAVLACNHSGTVPVDGMMVWADVVRNRGRVPRAIADHFVPTLPWVGVLFARSGMVGGSRGNVRAMLEAGELLLIFPEGVPGIGKPFKERYNLQKWRVGHAELAIRHQAPVVPVAVVGVEEQMPQIFRLEINIGAVPYIPIPLTPLPMPVRYRILYGEPIPIADDYRPEDADDPERVREAAARVEAAVQGLIQEGLRQRGGRLFT